MGHTPAYDKTGNQTDDGRDYTYVYDAFGRLRQVKTRGGSPALVAEYRSNGLGFRVGWHYDVNASGAVDSSDPWYWFCYDDAWRVVATFRAADGHPKEVFVHHAAGLDGLGGASYIDSVILRDREVKNAWDAEADEVRGERRYFCQNWRADVSAVLTDAGGMVEWVKYSAYGVPFSLPAGDTDSDGDWDLADKTVITNWNSLNYDVRADANLDGTVNASDITHANSITGGLQTLGRGVLSSAAVGNRRGYAGYEYDPTFEGAGRWLYHVRHRVYDADMGRWTRRDPLGYVDGPSLYEYVGGQALGLVDPAGLVSSCVTCIYSPPTQTIRPLAPTSPARSPGRTPGRRTNPRVREPIRGPVDLRQPPENWPADVPFNPYLPRRTLQPLYVPPWWVPPGPYKPAPRNPEIGPPGTCPEPRWLEPERVPDAQPLPYIPWFPEPVPEPIPDPGFIGPPSPPDRGRRNPGQRCENWYLDALQRRMHDVCDSGRAGGCNGHMSCDELDERMRNAFHCLSLRIQICVECYGGIDKCNPGHQTALRNVHQGWRMCAFYYGLNCMHRMLPPDGGLPPLGPVWPPGGGHSGQ